MKTSLMVLVHIAFWATTATHTYYDIERLISDKQRDYNKLIIPKINLTEPFIIQVGFDLQALREFDEVSEKFSVVGAFDTQWTDERMSWVSDQYNGLNSILVDHYLFWTPLFLLANAFDKYEKIGDDSYWPIRFMSTGRAMFFPGGVFTATCKTDVTYYPWDTHACFLLFVAYGNTMNEVQVVPLYDQVGMFYYQGHGEWDIQKTSIKSVYANGSIHVEFQIKRKPVFVVLNVIMPIVLLSFMGSFVFCIPAESGERISYGMTVLLAMSVFLTIVGQTLPSSAEKIAVLSFYIVSVIILNILIVFGIIVNMNFYFRGETKPLTTAWIRIVKCITCKRNQEYTNSENSSYQGGKYKTGYITKHIALEINHNYDNEKKIQTTRNNRNSFTELPFKIPEMSQNIRSRNKGASKQTRITKNKHSNGDSVTWKDVSSTLDICFFVLALLGTVVLTAWYFIYVIVHS